MNLRKNLSSYIALNNYVSAYRSNLGYKEVEYIEKKANELPKVITSWKANMSKNVHIYGTFQYGPSTTNNDRLLLIGNYRENNDSRNTCLNVEVFSGVVTREGVSTTYKRDFRTYTRTVNKKDGEAIFLPSEVVIAANDIVDFDVTISNVGSLTERVVINNTNTYEASGTIECPGEVSTYNSCIFIDNRETVDYKFNTPSYKIYSLTAEEDGVKVLDLVPVVRLSDNEVGFYDRVTGEFLGNVGEGTLLAGPDVEKNNLGLGNRLELKDAVNKPFESLSAYGYTEQIPEEYLDTVTAKGKCEIKKEYQTLVANGGTKQAQQTLQAMGKCGFVCVPDEYTQVESITTDGSSYIDTGIEYTNYTGFDLDFSMENTTAGIILGASNGSVNFNLSYSGSLSYGSSTSGIISTNTNRQRASLINQKITKSDGTTITITQPVVGGYAKNIYLGGINNNGSFGDGKSITIYAVRLYVKDKVVFDGVPARKDYTYGLYDTISGKFITNAGSGTISGSDDIFDPLPTGYTRVEYVENYSAEDKNSTNPLVKTSVVISNADNFKMDLESSITYNTKTGSEYSNSFYLMQSRTTNGSTITGMSGQGANNNILGAPGDGSNIASTVSRLNAHGHKAQYIFECKNGDMWLYVKDITTGQSNLKTSTYDSTNLTRSEKPLCIFGNDSFSAGHTNGNRLASGCKMYHIRIWKNDVLALDYVPAIRNSDGEVGFYDRVTDTFVTKAYTQGSLLAGPISISPKEIRCNNGVIEKDATSADKYKITPTVKETLVDFPDTEYTVLDYVENLQTLTHNGNFDTGIVPGNGVLKIDYDFQNVSNDHTKRNILAAGTTYAQIGTAIQLAMYINDRSVTPTYGEYTFYNLEPGETMNPFQLVTNDRMTGSWTINGNDGTNVFTGSLQDSITSTTQFGNDTAWRSQSIKCSTNGVRIYSLKVYVNDVLVGDFEPRRRNSDGILGLYNKVNDTFIASEKVDYPYSITCENLLSIPNTEYFDTQDILQGIKTKRIGVKVFDGTETWVVSSSTNGQFYLEDTTINYSSVSTGLCSHFTCIPNDKSINDYTDQNVIRIGYTGNNATWAQRLLVQKPGTTSLTAFTNWLASEYAAGRPVIVVYPLAKEETTHVSKPETLPENNVTLVKGALQDLELNKYEELEYITATGTQWIDTGILAASDIKAEVKFKPTINNSTYSVLGGRDGERANTFTIFTRVSGGTIRLDYGNNQSPISQTQSVSTENWNFITKDGANNYFNGSAISNNSAETFASTTNSIYLFTLNNNGTVSTYPFIGSIAYCKIWKAGVLVRNLVPVKRKSDDVVCMFDIVSNTFFENIGTGTFTAGPTVLPYEYTQLEYLQGDGTGTTSTIGSYIDTGVYSSNLTKTVVQVRATNSSSGIPVFGDYQAIQNDNGASNTLYYSSTYGFYTTDKGGSMGTGQADKTKLGNYDNISFHTITVDLKNRKGIFDGTETSLVNTTVWQSSRTQVLFARRDSGGVVNLITPCQIKSCKIYEDDVLVRDFVPARSRINNTVGMYDRVTKQFFTNANTSGAFVEGPVSSRSLGADVWTNNGIIKPYASLTGETTLSGTPTPSSPVSFINTQDGNIELRGINSTYADTLDMSTRKITRKVGVKVFDGTEDWETTAQSTVYRLTSPILFALPNTCICSHYTGVNSSLVIANMPNMSIKTGSETLSYMYIKDSSFSDNLSGFKQFLANQYAAGTPVIVYYPLETETEENIIPWYISGTQEQIEIEGNNLIDFDISVMAKGYYNNTANCWRIGNNWSYAISAPIEVIPGKTYRYSFTKQIAHDTSDNCVIGYSTLTAAQSDIVDLSATQGTKLVVCPSSDTTFGKQYGDYSYDITIPSNINYVRVTSIFENMYGSGNLYCETSTSDKSTNFRRVDISKPDDLLSISEDYTDTQYVQEGEKYIKCGVKVLDPTSVQGNNIKVYTPSQYIGYEGTDCAIEINMPALGYKDSIGYCSHLKLSKSDIWSRVDNSVNTFAINNSTGTSRQFHMCFDNGLTGIDKTYANTLSTENAREYAKDKIRDYIVAQYNAGTPIIIVYPLATTSEEAVSAIELQKNPTSVEVVKASLESESLPLTYDKAYDTSDPTPEEPKNIWCNNGIINGAYSELDYITATGTQYIQTTISGPTRWVGSGQGTSDAAGSKCILGGLATSGASVYLASRFGTSTSSSAKYWTIDGSGNTSGITGLTYVNYDITYNSIPEGGSSSTFTGTINGVSVSRANNDSFTTWYIGAAIGAPTPTVYGFVGNIYRQTAYQNGVVVGDFIPAIRNSDGAVGMYDTVSGTFLTNTGSGTFIAGNLIKNYIVLGTVEKLTDNVENSALCKPLLNIGDCVDIQEILTGAITHNCGVKVFDGTEEFLDTGVMKCYSWVSNSIKTVSDDPNRLLLCTHFWSVNDTSLPDADAREGGVFKTIPTNEPTGGISFGVMDIYVTVAAFKSWLAAQYAAGTPVIVVYPLATSTTENVSPQVLQKDPVTVQEASLEDLVVDTTKSIHTTPNPDFPLSIQNNNGILNSYSGKVAWKMIRGSGNAQVYDAVYLKQTTGTWQSWNDTGSGLVIPIIVGRSYTLSVDPRNTATTIVRFGQSNKGIPDRTEEFLDSINGSYYTSNMSSVFTATFTATRPYLVMQLSAVTIVNLVTNNKITLKDNVTDETFNYNSFEQLVYTGKNLNDVSTDTNGYAIDGSGTIVESAVSCYSAPIPVIPGHTYTWSGICGTEGLITSNNKRVHGYMNDTHVTQITWEEIPKGDPFIITFTVPSGVNNIRISHCKTDTETQVEEGARPTHYESYIQTKLPVDDLYSVSSDYVDTKNIITGNITRKCGVLVLTGEETYSWDSSSNWKARLAVSDAVPSYPQANVAPLISNSFIASSWNGVDAATPKICLRNASAAAIAFTVGWNPDITDENVWKAWLKKKYQEGDPVIIIYPLATSTTETSIATPLETNSSTNTVERISSTTNDLGISADYKKLK